eukprot:246531-Amphidinium_carterae.1
MKKPKGPDEEVRERGQQIPPPDPPVSVSHLLGGTEGDVYSHEVGACLLDKIGAILWEDAVQKFINDFQVDLAACCTRQTPCPATVDKAYDLLVDVKEARQSAVDGAPKIAALLIQSAVPLIDPKRVAKKYSMLLSRCNGPVEDCTMQILKGAEL